MNRTNLSEVRRGRIIGMSQSGMSEEDIANFLDTSTKTVRHWISKFAEEGEEGLIDHRKRNRAPNCTTEEEDDLIVAAMDENPFQPADRVLETVGLDVNVSTIYRRLQKAGVHCHHPAHKISLTDEHAEQRVGYALQHLAVTEEEWKTIFWMDEKTFSSSKDGRMHVWRPDNQRLDPKYVVPDAHSGRISIAYHGWMTAYGVGELTEVSPHMNAEEYIDILENVIVPSIRILFPEEDMPIIRFVHDNSAVHTSWLVRQWLLEHPFMQALNWPAKSPDLNPIENIWAIVTRSWVPGRDRTRAALAEQTVRSWEGMRLRPEICEAAVINMNERLQAVIDNNGWWTKY